MADPKKNASGFTDEEERKAAEYQKQIDEEDAKDENLRAAGGDPEWEKFQAEVFAAKEAAREAKLQAEAQERQQKIDYVNRRIGHQGERYPDWYKSIPVVGKMLKPTPRTDDQKAASAQHFADAETAKKVASEAYKNFYGTGYRRWAEDTQNKFADKHNMPGARATDAPVRQPQTFVRGDENEAGISEEKAALIREAMKKAAK